MKLRFDVDQAACARAGLAPCDSTVVVDLDAAKINLEVRNLIADRLIGNDVCQLWNSEKGTNKSVDANGNPVRLVAEAPTFDALMKAVLKDAQIVKARQTCHRAIALARANTLVESKPLDPAPVARPAAAPVQIPLTSIKVAVVEAPKRKPRKKRFPLRARKRRPVVKA